MGIPGCHSTLESQVWTIAILVQCHFWSITVHKEEKIDIITGNPMFFAQWLNLTQAASPADGKQFNR